MELLEPIQKNEIQYIDSNRRRMGITDISVLTIFPQLQIHYLILTSMLFLSTGSYHNAFAYAALYLQEYAYVDVCIRIKIKISTFTTEQVLCYGIAQVATFFITMALLIFQDTAINLMCKTPILPTGDVTQMAAASALYIISELSSVSSSNFQHTLIIPLQMLIVQCYKVLRVPMSVRRLLEVHTWIGLSVFIITIVLNLGHYNLKFLGSIKKFRQIFALTVPEFTLSLFNNIADSAVLAQVFTLVSQVSFSRGLQYCICNSLKSSIFLILDAQIPISPEFRISNYWKYLAWPVITVAVSVLFCILSLISIEQTLFGSSYYQNLLFYVSICVIALLQPFIQVMCHKLFSMNCDLTVYLVAAYHIFFVFYVYYASVRHQWFRDSYIMSMMQSLGFAVFLLLMIGVTKLFPRIQRRMKNSE